MSDDHEVILTLDRDQVIERAKASELELQYWRQVLADLHEVHDGIGAIADQLASSTGAVLGLLPLVKQAGTGSLETILESNNGSLARLRLMQETLVRTLDLVEGRGKVTAETIAALGEAAGGELDHGDN